MKRNWLMMMFISILSLSFIIGCGTMDDDNEPVEDEAPEEEPLSPSGDDNMNDDLNDPGDDLEREDESDLNEPGDDDIERDEDTDMNDTTNDQNNNNGNSNRSKNDK